MLLDTDLIRRRRMELGLSQRAVGRSLGVTSLTVARLEEGSNHDTVTLRMASRLADTLAVALPDLLTTDTPRPERTDANAVHVAGALLTAARGPVTDVTLADLLGTSPAETSRLLAELDELLRPAGLVVHSGPSGNTIVADATCTDTDQLRRLLQAQHATHGLNSTDASVLARAHAGTLEPARLGNADLVAVARLSNAGLLDDNCQLTDDVVYSLGLD